MNQNDANEIADFVIAHCDGLYRASDHAHIASYAEVHMKFGTFMVVRDEGKIVAVVRWNWKTPTHAKILDLIVHKDYRHKHIAKDMLLKAKLAMPQLEHISFHRKKYAFRTSTHLVADWLKEKSHGWKPETSNH